MRRWGGGTAAQGEATARHRPKLSGPTEMGRRIMEKADTAPIKAHQSRFGAMTGLGYGKKMNTKESVIEKRGHGGERQLTNKILSHHGMRRRDEHASSSSCKSLEALLAQSLLSPISIPSLTRVLNISYSEEAKATAINPHKNKGIASHTRLSSSCMPSSNAHKSEENNNNNSSSLLPPRECVFSPPRWGLGHSTTSVKNIDHPHPTPRNSCRMNERNEINVSNPHNPWHTPAEHNGRNKTSTTTATAVTTIECKPGKGRLGQFFSKIALQGKGVPNTARRHKGTTSTTAHTERKQGTTSLCLSRHKSLARRSSRVQLTKPSADFSNQKKSFDRKPTQRLLTSGHLFTLGSTGARVVRESTTHRSARGEGKEKYPTRTRCVADGDVGDAAGLNNNNQLANHLDPNHHHNGLEAGLASAGCSSTFRKFRDKFISVRSSAASSTAVAAAPAATRTIRTDYPHIGSTAAAFEWMNEGRNDCALAFNLASTHGSEGVLLPFLSSPFSLTMTTTNNKFVEIVDNQFNNHHGNDYGDPRIRSASGHEESAIAFSTISGETNAPRPPLGHDTFHSHIPYDNHYNQQCHNPNPFCPPPPPPQEWPRSVHNHRMGYSNFEEDGSLHHHNHQQQQHHYHDHQKVSSSSSSHSWNNNTCIAHARGSGGIIIADYYYYSSPLSFGGGYSSYGGGGGGAAVDFQNGLQSVPPPDFLLNDMNMSTVHASASHPANPASALLPHSCWEGGVGQSVIGSTNLTANLSGRGLPRTTTFDPFNEMASPFAFR